jgi:hypothetical protein
MRPEKDLNRNKIMIQKFSPSPCSTTKVGDRETVNSNQTPPRSLDDFTRSPHSVAQSTGDSTKSSSSFGAYRSHLLCLRVHSRPGGLRIKELT